MTKTLSHQFFFAEVVKRSLGSKFEMHPVGENQSVFWSQRI